MVLDREREGGEGLGFRVTVINSEWGSKRETKRRRRRRREGISGPSLIGPAHLKIIVFLNIIQ